MTPTHGLVSPRRLPSILLIGIGLSALTLFLVMALLHGWDYTLGWLFGLEWPYPRNLQIGSGWWFAAGFLTWLGGLFLIRPIGGRFARSMGFILGPGAAVWVLLSWVLSFLLYGFKVWPVDSLPAGVRWILDGPIMSNWRSLATWVSTSPPRCATLRDLKRESS